MKLFFSIIFFLNLLIINGITMSQSKDILINQEEDFADITFPILSYENFGNDKVKCNISGNYSGHKIEFTLISKAKYKVGITDNGFDSDAFEIKGIIIILDKNNGEEFFNLFSKVYGIKPNNYELRDNIEFTSFPLSEIPINILKDPLKTKVFYDDQNEREEYFELFINIDLPNKKVEFSEKDIEYRTNIIKVLSTKL